MKRITKTILLSLLVVLLLGSTAFASSNELKFTAENGTLLCEGKARVCYFIFDTEPGEYKVNGKLINSPFIHQYIEIEPASEIVIEGAKPKEMHFFDGTDVPSWVQKWEEPLKKADLLLISSHADDEQLFFAGLLPYYSQVKNLGVQVVYATDHTDQIERHHERLNGLWAVGIKNYPVSSGYRDLYSESFDGALANLELSKDDVISWERDILNRFTPKVVVSHDLNGEYGHGMHILISNTLKELIENESFAFLERAFLHLYPENQLSFDVIDQNFAELNGKTPFEVTKDYGFAEHKSQHWTWFKGWIEGPHTNYSPLKYGCIFSKDNTYPKTDFFDGLTSYEEDLKEAERIAEEARQKEEQERLEAEQKAEAEAKSRQNKQIMIAGISLGLVVLIIVFLVLKKKSKKEKYNPKH